MGLFDIDYDKGVWLNLPVGLRGGVVYSYLKALVSPLKWVYNLFNGYKTGVLYNLAHNGQVCYLEAVLNDTFDNDLRRITITDGPYKDAIPTFLRVEDKPVAVHTRAENNPVALFTRAEGALAGVQFYVNIPTAATLQPGYSALRVKSVVNQYRLVSKSNYELIIF